MPPKRRTLADFDKAAIAAPEPEATPTPSPVPAPVPASAPAKRSTPPRPVQATTAPDAAARVGLWFRPATFQDAKSAFLVSVDQAPIEVDNFTAWIGHVLSVYANKAPAARAKLAAALPAEEAAGGVGRTFELPPAVVEAVNDAVVLDRQEAGRVLSVSAWAVEAVRVAIEDARRRVGTLPPPPARLPRRVAR